MHLKTLPRHQHIAAQRAHMRTLNQNSTADISAALAMCLKVHSSRLISNSKIPSHLRLGMLRSRLSSWFLINTHESIEIQASGGGAPQLRHSH
jgi:hypothetical protein